MHSGGNLHDVVRHGGLGSYSAHEEAVHSLFGIDDRGRLEIAVTPEGEMKTTWEALLRAGFRMKDTAEVGEDL